MNPIPRGDFSMKQRSSLPGGIAMMQQAVAHSLLSLFGVGPVPTAQVLVSYSHYGQIRLETALPH